MNDAIQICIAPQVDRQPIQKSQKVSPLLLKGSERRSRHRRIPIAPKWEDDTALATEDWWMSSGQAGRGSLEDNRDQLTLASLQGFHRGMLHVFQPAAIFEAPSLGFLDGATSLGNSIINLLEKPLDSLPNH